MCEEGFEGDACQRSEWHLLTWAQPRWLFTFDIHETVDSRSDIFCSSAYSIVIVRAVFDQTAAKDDCLGRGANV